MLAEEIKARCKELRLGENIASLSQTTKAESHQEYLFKILQAERERRKQAQIHNLIKRAGFYCLKTFDDFQFDEVTLPASVTPESLKACEFLEAKRNIVMYGGVGTGKTFLSIALGIEARALSSPVMFFRTSALVNRLSEAKRSGTLTPLMKAISKTKLLILDEWGYIPLDITGSQLLFEVVSECYERRSLIINTNLEFSKWVNVFYDEQMTSAILDRVLHYCDLLLFPGPSNRIREFGTGMKGGAVQ